jgi:hypothetical protein
MLAAKKGKLKRQITSLAIGFAELPVSQLESLAAESAVKRVSFDASMSPVR